jgi:DNA polymerase (family 10)
MENKPVARTLRLLSQLMELYDENPFKIKSIAAAAFNVDKLPFLISGKSLEEMETITGIGKSTAAKIWELVQTKNIEELNDYIAKTPPGVMEMLQIKGIGPKKVKTIWKDLEIDTVGELYYACNENRLVEAKGFGLKTQEEIKKVIEFKMASNGQFLYAQVENFAESLLEILKKFFQTELISFTGAYRRKCEVISELSILTAFSNSPEVSNFLSNIPGLNPVEISENQISLQAESGIRISINFCIADDYFYQLLLQTGNDIHVQEVLKRLDGQAIKAVSEEALYIKAGLSYIEPELREGANEFVMSEAGKLPVLIKFADLKGTLHNHSTWSDGVHTMEEMALFCRDELKLGYLGMCDHSKSAFYANGLNESRVLAQHAEIDALNRKLAPFKIFKGIESDILFDGSLDYPDEILATFDFVVASVHSVLKMNEEKATSRLIKAIENPYTTILGHPTGRLLLSRSGYPIDYKKVIDACAANNVVIEINANPLRLDLDWRWHQYAIEQGVILSVNPDAHRKDGFYDMHYGVFVARKGGVAAENCLNSYSLDEITHFFEKKRVI